MILTGAYILDLIVRYNGIGKPLTNDEREILLFAMYNESEARDGIAAQGRKATDSAPRLIEALRRKKAAR